MLKNITMSAEQALIRRAREKALRERRTLNGAFREWLARYVGAGRESEDYDELMKKLSYAKPTKHYTREEMNARR